MPPLPAPSAEGNFSKTPVAHVLLYMRERKLTGSIVVECDADAGDLAGETVLLFDRGALAQARLPTVTDPLGVVMRDQGVINDAQLHESLAIMTHERRLQGEVLLEMAACTPAQLERGLREQVRRKALRLFGAHEGAYRYYADVDLLADFGAERYPEDVLSVLWRGVRAHPNPRAIDAVLARVGAQCLRLRTGHEVRLFELTRAEGAVLDLLRVEAASLETLLRVGPDPATTRALAYTLVISKQVELVATPGPRPATGRHAPASAHTPARPFVVPIVRPSTPPPSARAPSSPPAPGSVAPPPALSPELQAKLAAAEQRLAAMQDETYYQMLGVDPRASNEVIQGAFLELAATWHPDRAPPALRDVHQRVFALLNEAQTTLTDDTSRARYAAMVQDGGGTPASQRKINALIEAASDAQKAEVCVRLRDYDEAIRLARRSLAAHADDPNTLTVLATALWERQPPAPPDEVASLLTRAVELAPKNDRAHVLLGSVLKRKGDHAAALEHFKLAVAANPKNLDAAREVRLAEMRMRNGGASGGASTGAEGGGGLFSRFLKK